MQLTRESVYQQFLDIKNNLRFGSDRYINYDIDSSYAKSKRFQCELPGILNEKSSVIGESLDHVAIFQANDALINENISQARDIVSLIREVFSEDSGLSFIAEIVENYIAKPEEWIKSLKRVYLPSLGHVDVDQFIFPREAAIILFGLAIDSLKKHPTIPESDTYVSETTRHQYSAPHYREQKYSGRNYFDMWNNGYIKAVCLLLKGVEEKEIKKQLLNNQEFYDYILYIHKEKAIENVLCYSIRHWLSLIPVLSLTLVSGEIIFNLLVRQTKNAFTEFDGCGLIHLNTLGCAMPWIILFVS
ncbi:MAG: hypothetical protein LBJ93_01885 [Clostridiales bacterium]|jgi:hypothetical protein|nr:hypothetical protein [Clostridiales bacterium]